MAKRFIVLVVVFLSLLAVAGVYYYFTSFNEPESESGIYKFTGNIVSIEGETVNLFGVFDGPMETIPEELSSPREFSFRVNESTRFDKLEVKFPTAEELREKYGENHVYKYNIEDLPRVAGKGSLGDLNNLFLSNADEKTGIAGNLIIEADFADSITDANDPVAFRVFYEILNMATPQTQ